jgi:glucosamine--fructose-6-phosphate aminotransferase (isomerizing)
VNRRQFVKTTAAGLAAAVSVPSLEAAQVAPAVIARKARPVVISNVASSLALAAAPIPLPADMPEWLSPIAAIVPGQLLAFHLSRLRGFDPDSPRGLKKVTKTT